MRIFLVFSPRGNIWWVLTWCLIIFADFTDRGNFSEISENSASWHVLMAHQLSWCPIKNWLLVVS